MRNFFCLLFCLQSFIGIAQNDSLNKWRKSVSIDFSISGKINGVNIAPAYCLENNKNHFCLGPLVLYRNNESELTLTGIKFNYTFYPGTRQKVLDFYFDYDFLLQRRTVIERFYDNGSLMDKENVVTYFENYIGYGFKIKVLHHLYITHGIGIGYVFTHSKLYNPDDQYNGGYHENFYSGIVKIGFEYYFH